MNNQWYIDRRIATPDGSYPLSEALYKNAEDYVTMLEEHILELESGEWGA